MRLAVQKNFVLLVYLPLGYGPEQAKAVREDWNALLKKWKADGTYITSYVYPGEGTLAYGAQKPAGNGTLTTAGHRLTSSLIIRAEDSEKAALLANSCPVFGQGAIVEVREIQPRAASGN